MFRVYWASTLPKFKEQMGSSGQLTTIASQGNYLTSLYTISLPAEQ